MELFSSQIQTNHGTLCLTYGPDHQILVGSATPEKSSLASFDAVPPVRYTVSGLN